MAIREEFEVVGISQFSANMHSLYDKLTEKELRKLLKPGAKLLQREIARLAPKRSGTLSRSIATKVYKDRSNDYGAIVYTSFKKNHKNRKGKLVEPFYNWFVENGTKDRFRGPKRTTTKRRRKGEPPPKRNIPTGKVKAVHFVERAYENKIDEAGNLILDKLAQTLEGGYQQTLF